MPEWLYETLFNLAYNEGRAACRNGHNVNPYDHPADYAEGAGWEAGWWDEWDELATVC